MITLPQIQPLKTSQLLLAGLISLLAISPAHPTAAKPESAPETQGGTGQPTRTPTVSGGSRGNDSVLCARGTEAQEEAVGFTPLVPEDNTIATHAERANVYVYVPHDGDKSAQFMLRSNATGAIVFDRFIPLLTDGIIMRFVLPETVQLAATDTPEEGYTWSLRVQCNELNDTDDVVVQGHIHRLPAESAIAPEQLWYDTFEAAFAQRESHPDQWHEILKAHELEQFATVAIHNYTWNANVAAHSPTAE